MNHHSFLNHSNFKDYAMMEKKDRNSHLNNDRNNKSHLYANGSNLHSQPLITKNKASYCNQYEDKINKFNQLSLSPREDSKERSFIQR